MGWGRSRSSNVTGYCLRAAKDAIKFPDLIHAAKAEPDSDFPQPKDFISLMPESMHRFMWIFVPRGLAHPEPTTIHSH